MYQMIDFNVENIIEFNMSNTRGHNLKIREKHSRLNCRKYSFFNRTIPIWNKLSYDCVNSVNVLAFKARLYEENLEVLCRGRALTAAL